jgi:hypothetical protein
MQHIAHTVFYLHIMELAFPMYAFPKNRTVTSTIHKVNTPIYVLSKINHKFSSISNPFVRIMSAVALKLVVGRNNYKQKYFRISFTFPSHYI